MRSLFALLACLVLALPLLAEKPHYDTPPPAVRVPCGLNSIVYDWDFATGHHDFTTSMCDDQGVSVWSYGTTSIIPDAPGMVWGTLLDDDYPTDSGEALVAPTFTVDATTALLEVVHYYDMENLWDGGNVKVNGQLVTPLVGYPGVISVPGDWYSWCVDFEAGFTGLDSGWLTSCFDLSPFMGEEVTVTFEFGSDDMYTESGWYIAAVRVGSEEGVGNEAHSLSDVKGLFR